MRASLPDQQLFIQNREKLITKLKGKSLTIFHSNDIMPTNEDGVMDYVQNSNTFYLTGIDQEDTVLLLAPDFPDESLREVLFIRETSEHIARWEGAKYTREEAGQISGIQNIKWFHQLDSVLHTMAAEVDTFYLDKNEHVRSATEVLTKNDRFITEMKSRFPLHEYLRVAPIIYDQRTVKSDPEIEMLQKAIDVTEKGFRRVMSFLKPDVLEYELEAEFIHEFIRLGSRGFAYQPIIAAGANSCVLHYIKNDQPCKDGDLVLFDVGAKYSNYNADMTRVLPVNGRFTERQRAVYQSVLDVLGKAKAMLVPGNTIKVYHEEVGNVMTEELIKLGLLDNDEVKKQDPKKPLYKKYFMHGTSHYLGVGVHDVGSYYQKLEPGMVLTVEPGIYIPEEGIGIRLEDDVVVQSKGNPLNLMKNIPIEIEEIEELMSK